MCPMALRLCGCQDNSGRQIQLYHLVGPFPEALQASLCHKDCRPPFLVIKRLNSAVLGKKHRLVSVTLGPRRALGNRVVCGLVPAQHPRLSLVEICATVSHSL